MWWLIHLVFLLMIETACTLLLLLLVPPRFPVFYNCYCPLFQILWSPSHFISNFTSNWLLYWCWMYIQFASCRCRENTVQVASHSCSSPCLFLITSSAPKLKRQQTEHFYTKTNRTMNKASLLSFMQFSKCQISFKFASLAEHGEMSLFTFIAEPQLSQCRFPGNMRVRMHVWMCAYASF